MNVSTLPRNNRAWVEVDLANLVANARAVEAAAGARLLPMVKARAYGLGVRLVETLEQLEPWGYGVATVDEGIELRDVGIRRPIVVFTPPVAAQQETYRTHDLRAALDDPDLIAQWRLPFHVEIDTGMGRCGIRWDDARLSSISTPHLEGAFTHFLAADEGPETVVMQWSRFERSLSMFATRPSLVHASNSAGAWRLEQKLDLVRPGIFLYGGAIGHDLPAPAPVASVRARVVSLRRVARGETVSYGGEWAAPCDTTVATIGIGYADGVRRSVQGKAHTIINGVRYPMVGRVTMDFVMVDLGHDESGVAVGDVATVIGRDESQEVTLDEFAEWAGTISYEILTGLGTRVPRMYVGD